MDTKKELSYFRLKLENYLSEHFPELLGDKPFITARADDALSTYCDAVAQDFSHPEAESMASEVLHWGLHFSKYDTLVSVLENEFEKELPSPLPERLSPILLKNKAVQSVFDKYELTDDFTASPEYEKLYTELTGTIVLLIEVNGPPTIGGENMTWCSTIGSLCSVKSQDKRSTPHAKSFSNTWLFSSIALNNSCVVCASCNFSWIENRRTKWKPNY